MNALTTAQRVLRWAAAPSGPVPSGILRAAGSLAEAGECAPDVRRLVSSAGALLAAGDPPWADGEPVGPGVVLMAAAAGVRADSRASQILDLVAEVSPRRDGRWAEALARHALVAPVLGASASGIPADLADRLRAMSPLTAVFLRPPTGPAGRTAALDLSMRLLGRPHGAASLTAVMARPSDDPLVLDWRTRLLRILREQRPGLMLDVYLAARLRYGAAWDARIAAADAAMTRVEGPDPLALATVRFWGPLADTERAEIEAGTIAGRIRGVAIDPAASIRARTYLTYADYGRAVRLFARYRDVLTIGDR
ncbi:hypothetical protein ACIA5D_23585 [Actinoplanes sp. NPDC051513]|uniref:hypothetical protein n=1 Tax=Actinoplanes sp. NPDC051513 TaxID=3363908 RepID=UPI003792483A